MKARYRILPEGSGREVPPEGHEAIFRVISADSPLSLVKTIAVMITATDPAWGPDFARIEGFTLDEHGTAHEVIGYHLIGKTHKDSIGLIEIHSDDA
jgi:hypothetical protein